MIFAAVGFIALAKLDRDRGERRHLWPTKNAAPPPVPSGEVPAPIPQPIELPERLSGEEFQRLTNRELSNIRLLPLAADADPVSFLWPTDGNDGPAHPELLPFAQATSFDAWKSFTDEHIGFYYPDAPGIQVEVLAPTDPIPLLAETMLPGEAGTFKRYRISAGGSGSLCVISLAHAESFDDGPREPQPEIFHRFTPGAKGGLLRTGFTEQGQVRRVELLDNGLRASLIDWPHLAVHQDIYLRIGSSMQLVGPHQSFAELADATKSKYGLEARLGFLDHGISESEIIATLGTPVARDEQNASLDYFQQQDGDSIFYRLNLKNGMFAGFGNDWREIARAAPDQESIRWLFEKTDYRAGEAGGIGYNLGALTDADAQAIFDRFVELAPSAPADDWSQLCGVIANLAQHGLRDPRVTEIVRGRLESSGGDPQPALLALERCDNDLAKAAIAEHVIATLTLSKVPPEALEHVYTLITYLGKEHPATGQLIDRALSHESAAVRELGFQFCTWLPEKFATPYLEAGLRDQSTEIRLCSARAFAISHGDQVAHPEILASRLKVETDEQARQLLQEALERLGCRSQSSGQTLFLPRPGRKKVGG